MNIDGLIRQHSEIRQQVSALKLLIENDIASNSFEMAKQISFMSGKLKVHLQSEDKYLYPKLLESNNSKLSELAKDYIVDMGNISNTFEIYKNKYNTKSKINSNLNKCIKETKEILGLLEKRLDKEDKELYPTI